ncbi:hypothetical protein, partial [Arthrobacter burdickii]
RFIRLVFPRRYIHSLFHSLFPCQIPRRGLQGPAKESDKTIPQQIQGPNPIPHQSARTDHWN